mgnify:CR=1 FL=1
MTTKRSLYTISATLNEDVSVKNNVNGTPYVSVMATLANGKTRRLQTYSKQAINALKGMKKGDTKILYGHFGAINQETGNIQKKTRSIFFPLGKFMKKKKVTSQKA